MWSSRPALLLPPFISMWVDSVGITRPTLAAGRDKATTLRALFAQSAAARRGARPTRSLYTGAMPPLRIRQGARAVILDRDHNILLAHFDFVDEEKPTGLWACPGGGIDPGESLGEGLIRELAEETGLVITDPGRAGLVAAASSSR